MKEVFDIADIEGSIAAMVEKDKEVWVSKDAAKFFWESRADLGGWAGSHDATVELINNGYLIKKE